MKFDEWFETLETRDQRRADKDLLKEAHKEGQKDMRERAAGACEFEYGAYDCYEKIKELEVE